MGSIVDPSAGGLNVSSLRTLAKKISESLTSIRKVVSTSLSPIPQYHNVPENDSAQVKLDSLFSDLRKIGVKDVETLLSLLNSEVKGVQDDNNLLLEHLVRLLSKLDMSSPTGKQLASSFVGTLWNGLPHPPLSSLGSQYKYREADGSFNNIRFPDIGKAGTPYARSAKSSVLQNIALPDPGQIFDSLMARGETFEPHPNKISSQLFYLGTVIIHDIFRTDRSDFNNNMASSYLDLAPLYGSNQVEQDIVRTFKDGKLKPDCFSEKRVLGFPPGVGVLLIMFNRFHNNVVTKLALINEGGRFNRPSNSAAESTWKKYDNDLFQTGRLITCGLYVNCILKDYVRTILSLNRTGSKWTLDPRTVEGRSLFNTPPPEATGNQVSAEFNLIYRWHATISPKDEKWTQDLYERMFPGRKPEEVPLGELLAAFSDLEAAIPDDPVLRTFDTLERQGDGSFNDDDLVKILESSISDVAGSFGANKVPTILRAIDVLGIIQGRAWNMATLNEFREFSGLTRHKTFEDINPDPEIARRLRNLYDDPDFVELYPGLIAEKTKPPMTPGSGLCVNFTTSYAILADAVALVRGDRFYTIDYTPKNLTNWGFNEVQYDTSVDDGAVLYKLILNAFPKHFKGNSIYAHFPFVTPEENLKIQTSLGRAGKYSWDKPARVPDLIIVKSAAASRQILSDQKNWKVTWGESIEFLASQPNKINGVNFALAGDGPANTASRALVKKGLYPAQWRSEVYTFYEDTTKELLEKYSFRVPGTQTRQVDIVRDVANLVNVQFSASLFSLPLKTPESPRGIYTEQELYQVMAVLFIVIFYNADVTKSFQLREAGYTLAQQLGDLVLLNVEAVASVGFISNLIAKFNKSEVLGEYGTHMIQRLLESGLPVKDVVWTNLLPFAAAMVANQAQLFSQALDFYLGEGKQYISELHRLSLEDTKEADDKILKYFMEAARLRATVGLYRDYIPSDNSTTPITIKDSSSPDPQPEADLTIAPGRRVLIDLISASRDPIAFPSPNEVRLDRPLDSYLHYGYGPHQCAGMEATMTAMTAMFKTVFRLKGLRRATTSWGDSPGELKTVEGPYGITLYMTPDQGAVFPFPTTMKIVWDEDE